MRLTIETIRKVGEIPKDDWNRLVGDGSPFVEWGFLTALEESGCLDDASGWHPQIVVVRDDSGRLLAAAPMYLKMHSQGEFVFDWAWADAANRAGIRYYPKAVVASPFSPVTGVRLLVASEHAETKALKTTLMQGCLEVAREMGLSSVHFNFVAEDEVEIFREAGLLMREGIQYHWKNRGYETFDDYLAEFRAKPRANVRRERRLLAEGGVQTRILQGDAIDRTMMKRMFRYYRSTVQKFYWGSQYLTSDFFEVVLEKIPERLQLVVAEHHGEVFAGAFNMVKGDRLYGRYWGCEREVEFTHFEVCMYRAVQWCIENGIQVFEPGAGGEHKHDRGFEATVTHSAHWIADSRLADAIARHLEFEREQIARNVELLDAQGPFRRGD